MRILYEYNPEKIVIAAACTHAFKRNYRFENARKIGFGNPVSAFVVDNHHPNGNEIHIITDTELIFIQNEKTKNLTNKYVNK